MKSTEVSLVSSTAAQAQLGEHLLQRFVPGLERGVHWGLERIEEFLGATGDPHLSYPVIHVGGTNGKGSVAASLASVLNLQGHSVGLYTSPHLCSFNERIQVGSSCVTDRMLRELISELGPEMEKCGLSFFEAVTGLAFHVFQRSDIGIAVIEVGLGGRLDATNVVEPISTIITNIQMDHKAYLGETKQQIAREKLGIVKEGTPLFTSETDAELLDIFSAICGNRNSTLTSTFYENPITQMDISVEGTSFYSYHNTWDVTKVCTPLIGRHQALNTCLAMAVLDNLPDKFRPGVDVLEKGIKQVNWPGRIQIEKRNDVTWVFDVAHNKAGAAALVDTLNHLDLPSPSILLVSVLGDKDWEGIFLEMAGQVDHVILTQSSSAPNERRWDLNEVSAILDWSGIEVCPDLGKAVAKAQVEARSGTVVVTGSAHTVGDVLNELELNPYSTEKMVRNIS